ncbi:MAG: T9SS type A sorting domain-containing protein [Bacteroidales bacterium]|jgi:hypothetical protein|nr:T9SS type A sorting domain-containing protein [Bacteroidales bacterium]
MNQSVLSPNLVNNYVYIQNDNLNRFQTINIYNIMGQGLINQQLLEEIVQKIDLNYLPIGVYVVRVITNTRKIFSDHTLAKIKYFQQI